ncbi:WD40 repeat domain-containing protein [Limnospira fusiformis KN01]|uniref:WD40 repeat domain-containing protein n=1 Tax=Limnospira fusiformis TaxID=54297 RepID=UPI001F1655EF|nr:WD40 repeat domain-containing protein [Limnospira fusiformis]ULB45466.1 WD40 repeat domain-containing protein [Limnospira fusiformis KN01]
MAESKVSRQSEGLLSWLTIAGLKCGITEKRDFLTLAASLVLLNSVEIIPAWKRLLNLAWKIVSTILWCILILIIMSSFGRYFAFGSTSSVPNYTGSVSNSTVAIQQADQVTVELDTALVAAREAALKTASDELDTWINDLKSRVDSDEEADFLDWYFGYWTQQKFGLNGMLQAGQRVFNKNLPTAKEKIQEEVLQQFQNRVLRPEYAKLKFKNISRCVAKTYTRELKQNLDKIPVKYNIPKADWDEYLEALTVSVTNVDGRKVPLQLKALTTASLGIGSGALLAKATSVGMEKVTAKIATKVVGKAGASMLGKAGALAGGELLGPLVAVGIIFLDAADIRQTEVDERPILKRNIEDYFNELKTDILTNEENGIEKVILDIENSKRVRKGMSNSRYLRDDILKLWDLETGTELATLTGHSNSVNAVAIAPDGKRAVSASDDNTLKLWDLETGTELATLTGHSSWVRAVAITPDGKRAVSASSDKTLKLWDLETGTELATLTGHSSWVRAVAITPDGKRAVSASMDKTLKLWDLERGTELATLKGHRWVNAVAIAPDGKRAVSASGQLKLWDLERGTELATLKGHSDSVWGVAIAPDGKRAVSASDDSTLKLWDLETGTALATLTGHSLPVRAVAIAPHGKQAVSGSWDETLKLWDLATGEVLATFIGDGEMLSCAIAPDGVTVVAGDLAGRVYFLRLEGLRG